MTTEIRTRFAPSPTGYLHIGGARTALFNYLYARARGGKFIVRVEDTDQERSSAASEKLILDALAWLGIKEDEGVLAGGPYTPYRQSERLDTYRKYVDKLITQGKAYHCFCTDAELTAKQEKSRELGVPHIYDGKCRSLSPDEVATRHKAGATSAIRFRIEAKEVVVNDVVQGRVKFDSRLIGDFIIVKSDGFPSYNFAVVIDDHEMAITHVIRGVGHLSNTPRQILIHEALGLSLPSYSHISEIVGTDKKKLSKRRGATNVLFFQQLGYLPEAVVNYMSLLGWYPRDGVEYMPTGELEQKFDIEQCSKSPAMFDFFIPAKTENEDADEFDPASLSRTELEKFINKKSKLNWLNNKYIRDLPESVIWPRALEFLKKEADLATLIEQDAAQLKKAFFSVRVYLDTLDQAPAYLREVFKGQGAFKIETEEARAILKDETGRAAVRAFADLLGERKPQAPEDYSNLMKEAGERSGAKGRGLFMPIRVASTGSMQGLELPTLFSVLGYAEVVRRIEILLAQAN